MKRQTLVVTFDVGRVGREVVGEVIGEVADIIYLTEVKATHRADTLYWADLLLARNTATDLTPDERALIGGARLLQFYTAGVDFIPLQALSAELPIASRAYRKSFTSRLPSRRWQVRTTTVVSPAEKAEISCHVFTKRSTSHILRALLHQARHPRGSHCRHHI